MSMGEPEPGLNRYQAVDQTIDSVERIWQRFLALGERTWRVFGLEAKLQAAKQYAMSHPVLTLCALITFCMCSIPVMCFMFFAMGTMFLTFLGFLFVEGFLLTFASLLLGGALFFFGLLSIGASSFLAIGWYLFSSSSGFIHNIIRKFSGYARTGPRLPFNLFRYEHTNGECVKDIGTEKED